MANKKNTETVPNINDVANLKKDFKDRRDYEEEQNKIAQEEYNDKEKELVDKLVNEMSGKKKSRAKEFIKKGAISIVALATLFGFTKFKNWYTNREPDITDDKINNLTAEDDKEATENSIEDEYGIEDTDGNVVSINEAASGSVRSGSLNQDHTITEENVNEGIEETTDPSKDTVEIVQENNDAYKDEIEEAKKTSTTTTLNENVTAATKNETTTTNTTTKDESTKIDTNTETKKVESEEEKSKTNTTNTVEETTTTSTQNNINQEIDDSGLDDLYDLTK